MLGNLVQIICQCSLYGEVRANYNKRKAYGAKKDSRWTAARIFSPNFWILLQIISYMKLRESKPRSFESAAGVRDRRRLVESRQEGEGGRSDNPPAESTLF